MGFWKTLFGRPEPPPEPEDTSARYAILHGNLGWRATVTRWWPREWNPRGDYPGYWSPGHWYSNDLVAKGWPTNETCILPTRDAAEAAIEAHRSGASTWRPVDKGACNA